MAVSKRTRYEVLRRDNHTCRYCGATAPEATLTIDHVTPVSLGGSDDPSNLVAACKDCNAGKASSSPDATLIADVEQRALQWSAAVKLAAEKLAARDEPRRKYVEYLEDVVTQYFGRDEMGLPYDWRETFDQFYRAGLPKRQVEKAIDISMSKHNVPWSSKWRYACGIAWTMIRELHDEAERIVSEGD